MHKRLAAILLVALTPSTAALAAGLALPPEEACAYLTAEGLGTGGEYREYRPGKYYCWSLRREIAAGDPERHKVRYAAEGAADSVSSLALELELVSHREVQRAHRLLLDYARALTQRALGTELPEEVGKALLSGRAGRWPVASAEAVIEKRQIQGKSHELVFRLE